MPRVRTTLFFIFRVLLFSLAIVVASLGYVQAQENRYAAYSTYLDPDPNVQTNDSAPVIAANTNGQVCTVTVYFLSLLNPDGTFAYAEALSSPKIFRDVGNFRVAADSTGDCFVTGRGSIVPTPGAYQSGKSSGMFVVKFDPQGNTVFATYVGGSGIDTPLGGIALDSSENVWLTGITNSNDFPVTPNAIQSSFQGGATDAFIAELNPSGTALLYGTYLGGSGDESNPEEYYSTGGIAIDAGNNVYVSGITYSTNFPVLNALQSTLGGASFDAFVTKISDSGTLLYSTYLGETGAWISTGIAADSTGEAIVTAYADDTGSGIVAKLNAADSALVYSLSLGPDSIPDAIQVNSQGNISFSGINDGLPLVNPVQSSPSCCFVGDLDPNGNVLFLSYVGAQAFSPSGFSISLGIDSNNAVYLGTPPP